MRPHAAYCISSKETGARKHDVPIVIKHDRVDDLILLLLYVCLTVSVWKRHMAPTHTLCPRLVAPALPPRPHSLQHQSCPGATSPAAPPGAKDSSRVCLRICTPGWGGCCGSCCCHPTWPACAAGALAVRTHSEPHAWCCLGWLGVGSGDAGVVCCARF